VVHSKDKGGYGGEPQSKLIKKKSQFSQMAMGQYWLGKTKLSDWPEMLSKRCKKKLFNKIFY